MADPAAPAPSMRETGKDPAERHGVPGRPGGRRRALALSLTLALGFAAVSGQLVRLAAIGQMASLNNEVRAIGRGIARPDIVDRAGRLLATDIVLPSLFADPSRIIDLDDAVERLSEALPDLDPAGLRRDLSDRERRFVWLERGMHPDEAQKVLELGIPGLAFREELRRVYPGGDGTGNLLGYVDIDNRGRAGLERYVDGQDLVDLVDGPTRSERPPVVASIDLAAQHILDSELTAAVRRYDAESAAGLVMDVRTGEIIAAVSLPAYPAGDAAATLEPRHLDRLLIGTYELGSVFKTLTFANAFDLGTARPDKIYDATEPLKVGRFTIDDFHGRHRPLTAEEVFIFSSNIGTARMASEIGAERQQAFLDRLGLLAPLPTELGEGAPPQRPETWSEASMLTVSFGHGLAVTPLSFAAAVASIVNGGRRITPTFLKVAPGSAHGEAPPDQVVTPATARLMRDLLRANVAKPGGTGGRAAVPGYRVGGKTGTADIAGKGGYVGSDVLTSFVAVFPADEPRYLSFVLLWKPKGTNGTGDQTAAGHNAAPTTARIITRIAPLLGLEPDYRDPGM